MTAATRAAELHKFFNNFKILGSNGLEEIFFENARRVSTPLATMMLNQMGLTEATETPFKVFENACGVGVVGPVLQHITKPDVLKNSSILCGDFSEQFIELAKKTTGKLEGWEKAEARRIDAQKTGLEDGAFTHVATNIGLHVVPDSEAALNGAETIRILQPGGVLGFTTWHLEVGWMTLMREAFNTFPFEAPMVMPMQVTSWGRWSDVNWIRKTLEEKGLEDVKVNVSAFLSHTEGVDAFMTNFDMMLDVIMTANWSEELRKEHPKEEVKKLMKEYLEKRFGDDGWDLSWVAVIATARVPSGARG
ncbi:S-adenosyl-L-methionine-dependent methyltransferase [Chaetomium tenue]|uniref:S-adenosyl-L-methionine-dependent methyltransferase n=1 Tax=Chaetomium tenue TaxID=1854479 RepID=A0ACB7P7S4_9PEZI|nr:S-adenosyl-L-methionine-dependent methyltransferase [Chaetomium globosum]